MSHHSSPSSRAPFWLWPHLLSLEAPLIAMAWMLGLAHLNRVPVMPGVLAGLGLCVWMIYVLDRLLDTRGKADSELDARHRFHRRHRVAPGPLGVRTRAGCDSGVGEEVTDEQGVTDE